MTQLKGLNTALTALYANQRAIEVAGQNVANVNTEGYTRQRVNLAAINAPVTPAIHSRSTNEVGGGVQVVSVERLQDAFLTQRANQEHATAADLNRAAKTMASVEQIFGEPSDNGIQSQMSDFAAAWQDVANNPNDEAARTQMLNRAATLASGLNKADADMVRLREQSTNQMQVTVTQVNSLSGQIAKLNESIQMANIGGVSSNELADQRDLLVGKLAEMVGGTVKPADNGMVNVYLGSNALVRGTTTGEINQPGVAGDGSVTLTWKNDGSAVDLTAGELQGLRKTVNTTLSATAPEGYRTKLNAVASALMSAVNTQHQAGKDLQDPAQSGLAFFTGTTAADIAVNPAIANSPKKVAAAAAGAGKLDGTNADAMTDLLGAAGSAADVYSALVVGLGVEADTANRRATIQSDVVTSADASKNSVSGVNLDEEMANLVQYQHAYNAAARVLSAVDQMMDTLINRTGV
jgi:flagellar hook-associated protein 1 FlgK